MRKVETERSDLGCAVRQDGDERVGSDFQSGKTASNDERANDESTKDGLGVERVVECLMSDRPEEDSTERIERETHDDRDLVTVLLHDLSRDGREAEITATEISDLKTGRFELGNVQVVLEVLVQDIEQTVSETPQEEEGGDEDERPQVLAFDETVSKRVLARGRARHDGSAAGHVEKRVEGGWLVSCEARERRLFDRGSG